MAKIYAAEMPVLEMGRILKNKLSPLRVNELLTFNCLPFRTFEREYIASPIFTFINYIKSNSEQFYVKSLTISTYAGQMAL